MKKNKLRFFPPGLMLVAGSIASIMTYRFQYEIKAALLILLSVLLAFYIFGLIIVKIITDFDRINEEKRLAEEQEALENMDENSELEQVEVDDSEGEPDEEPGMSQNDSEA
ncbi:MAG: hypothetical protein MR383_09105 [Lachnospiraceae bacterium]|nr:hypothetical protein [Lachnospiraceae bacterium]